MCIHSKADREGIHKDLNIFAEQILDFNNIRKTSENIELFKVAVPKLYFCSPKTFSLPLAICTVFNHIYVISFDNVMQYLL